MLPDQDEVLQVPWIAPLDGHPAAIVHAGPGALETWISWAYNGDFDRSAYSGHIFLYNISLETFAPDTFLNLWTRLYGYPAPHGLLDVIESLHILIPFHYAYRLSERRRIPDRLPHWLNWGYMTSIARELSRNSPLRNAAMSTMRRTWVSFVPVMDQTLGGTPSQLRGKDPTVLFEGEYAFGIYAFAERTASKEIDFEKDQLFTDLAKAYSKDREPQTTIKIARDYVADRVRLVLAAGIDEPFTSYDDKGRYKYDLLLSCASRDYLSDIQRRTCALRAHVNVLSRLWCKRLTPLELSPSDFFLHCPDVIRGKELRLDAFLAWAELAIRDDSTRSCWSIRKIPTNKIPSDSFMACLRSYNEWEPAFSKPADVGLLLRGNEICLPQYAVFPGQKYYRSDIAGTDGLSPKANLERVLKAPLETALLTIARGERPATPIFLFLAASGTGKTELAKAACGYFSNINQTVVAVTHIEKVAHKSVTEIEALIANLQKEALEAGRPGILVLDEVHKVQDIRALVARYTIFEEASRLVFILLTSYADGRYESFKAAVTYTPTPGAGTSSPTDPAQPGEEDNNVDFFTRTHPIELPSFAMEDELLVLGSALTEGANRDNIQVEKRVLAFFLTQRPDARTNLGRTMRSAGQSLHGTTNGLTYDALRLLLPQEEGILGRFSAFSKSPLARSLGNTRITVLRAWGTKNA